MHKRTGCVLSLSNDLWLKFEHGKDLMLFFRVELSADFSNCTQENENPICLHPTKLLFVCTNVSLCIQGGAANTMTHTVFPNTGFFVHEK